MALKACYLSGLITLLVVSSCASPSPAEQVTTTNAPLIVKRNSKYNLSLLFYGEKLSWRDGTTTSWVQYVSLRDDATGKEIKYQLADPNLALSLGYFTDIWSPDEEYLLLSLGRFKGFCIMKAAAALNSIEQNHCDDTLKVYAGDSPDGITGLWHDFQKWDGKGAFSFKAGLSDKDVLLGYDFAETKLTAFEPLPTLSAENAKGKLVITHR